MALMSAAEANWMARASTHAAATGATARKARRCESSMSVRAALMTPSPNASVEPAWPGARRLDLVPGDGVEHPRLNRRADVVFGLAWAAGARSSRRCRRCRSLRVRPARALGPLCPCHDHSLQFAVSIINDS